VLGELDFVSFEDRKIHDVWLVLDNHRFVRCQFERVTFLYSGGPWMIEDCYFHAGCKLVFQGAAFETMKLASQAEYALGLTLVPGFPPPKNVQ